MLDENQAQLHTKFSSESWLASPKHIERIIDWTTFYRRNIPAFVQHYFGLTLYLYQVICLYLLNLFGSIGIVAARASAKSFLIAVYACARCILYPGSHIVVASATKKQAALIVKEKIEKELVPRCPNLAREIVGIKTNNNDIEVKFRNMSSIVVVAGNDNSRGYRSTVLVLEEFRHLKKKIVDSVLRPFQIARQTEFSTKDQYKDLIEEPINIYISSSGTTSEWIWDTCKNLIRGKFKDNSSCLIAMDYSIALRHGIKTKAQLVADKQSLDSLTFRIEYENEMLRENTSAFFSYEMITRNQVLRKCFYPRNNGDVLAKKKNPYEIPKQPGEMRVLSCDIAFVDRKNNDNSVFSCVRLLPESMQYKTGANSGSVVSVKKGYRRVLSYIEANKGGDVDRQAIRIKQLFYDFGADYVVLDTRNGGILVYDRLAKFLYDEDRDVEYRAWQCINDETIANRVIVTGAEPVVFAINASQKLNSDIATCMRDVLESKRIDLLVSHNEAVDDILNHIPEYANALDADTMVFYERPYLETQELISEMIALEYERGEQTGVYKIFEVGTNTKDRYTSVSYANWFASLLEQDLLSDQSDYDYMPLVN